MAANNDNERTERDKKNLPILLTFAPVTNEETAIAAGERPRRKGKQMSSFNLLAPGGRPKRKPAAGSLSSLNQRQASALRKKGRAQQDLNKVAQPLIAALNEKAAAEQALDLSISAEIAAQGRINQADSPAESTRAQSDLKALQKLTAKNDRKVKDAEAVAVKRRPAVDRARAELTDIDQEVRGIESVLRAVRASGSDGARRRIAEAAAGRGLIGGPSGGGGLRT